MLSLTLYHTFETYIGMYFLLCMLKHLILGDHLPSCQVFVLKERLFFCSSSHEKYSISRFYTCVSNNLRNLIFECRFMHWLKNELPDAAQLFALIVISLYVSCCPTAVFTRRFFIKVISGGILILNNVCNSFNYKLMKTEHWREATERV